MARRYITGFATGSSFLDTFGSFAFPAGLTYDTGTVRTGPRSLKLVAPSGASSFATVLTAAYNRVYVRVTTLPTTARTFAGAPSTVGVHGLRLNTNGSVSYMDGTTGTAVGTSITKLTDNTRWYRIEWNEAATVTSAPVLVIDGLIEVTATFSGYSNSNTLGCDDTVAATYTAFYADFASDDATYPGDGAVVLSLPISDNNRGAWTAGAGATTSLFDAVNNLPPVGVAAASETNASQIKSATNSATDNCDLNMQSYTTAGVPGGATVQAVQAVVAHGEEILTGTKAGAVTIVSNPAQSGEDAFTFGDDAGAEGTYPTLWGAVHGTIQSGPTVIPATSPVVRVGKRTATTRVVGACFVGLYIDYTLPLVRPRYLRQAVKRAGFF